MIIGMETKSVVFIAITVQYVLVFLLTPSVSGCEIAGSYHAISDRENGSSCQSKSNTSCSVCVRDFDCYWCVESKYCGDRPTIKPSSSECDGKWFSYSQCTINGNLLLIIVPIVLVVLIAFFVVCIYCCCCRQCCKERRMRKWAKEDSRKEARKNERQAKYEARTEEMRIRHDNIRKKYGLFKDDKNEYERFDAS